LPQDCVVPECQVPYFTVPAHFRSSTMGFVAITFMASTAAMLVATAWEFIRRAFSRHFGQGA
jgi:hypothetical protein